MIPGHSKLPDGVHTISRAEADAHGGFICVQWGFLSGQCEGTQAVCYQTYGCHWVGPLPESSRTPMVADVLATMRRWHISQEEAVRKLGGTP